MGTDTRTRMIEATSKLVQAHGYHGTSLNDILEESNTPRGSLYFHFPGGKAMLILEAVKAEVEEINRALESSLQDAQSPAEGVRDFYRIMAEALIESNYQIGCPVAPIALDTPEIGSELNEICTATFDHWKNMYREAFRDAGIAADRARRLARTVLAASEGALMIARNERSTIYLEEVGDEMAELVHNTMTD